MRAASSVRPVVTATDIKLATKEEITLIMKLIRRELSIKTGTIIGVAPLAKSVHSLCTFIASRKTSK